MRKDEEPTFGIEDIEKMAQILTPEKRANIIFYKAEDQALKGNVDNFILGISLIEKLLKPKLDNTTYFEDVKRKREELGINPSSSKEQRLELALFKYEKLNQIIEKKIPKPEEVEL